MWGKNFYKKKEDYLGKIHEKGKIKYTCFTSMR